MGVPFIMTGRMGIQYPSSSPSEDIIDIDFPLYFTLHGVVSTLAAVSLPNPSSSWVKWGLLNPTWPGQPITISTLLQKQRTFARAICHELGEETTVLSLRIMPR
jgi:hypothetical protein